MEQDFDNFADEYRQTHTANVKSVSGADSYYFAEFKVKELLRYERNVKCRLLDVGCGDGATEIFMKHYLSNLFISGVDVSQKSIKIAKNRKLLDVFFYHYDGDNIPFEDNTFDIVFMAGVLHHVPPIKRQQLVNEVFRVLKPQGRFYLFEHNPYNPLTRYLVNTCVFDEGVQLLKARESKSLLNNAGLKILTRKFVIFFPRSRFFKLLHKTEPMLAHIPLGGQYYFRAVKE